MAIAPHVPVSLLVDPPPGGLKPDLTELTAHSARLERFRERGGPGP